MTIGSEMHKLVEKLFPICRSITGEGVRSTLKLIKEEIPELNILSVPSGHQAFDWTVPKEWNIKDAYVMNEQGEKVIDFNKNNLHVVGYSQKVDEKLSLDELLKKIHCLPELPDAIPYVTSYYSDYWGFCLSYNDMKRLTPGEYHVVIDATHSNGELNYGELILPGETKEEVLLSTYVCHPSMANNELSGPVVTTYLVKWLKNLPTRKYTYRIVLIPETIGSVVYIHKNLHHLKKNVVAGYIVTCVGDDREYSFLPSRDGNTLSDKVARYVLKEIEPNYRSYSWLERGSDERQYCAPGIDLPISTIMRTKYGEYPEYHTSLDDLNLVTPDGLEGGYNALRKALELLEKNFRPLVTVLCEPQLGKRGLYPNLSTIESQEKVIKMLNLLSYCDGKNTVLDIALLIDCSADEVVEMLQPMISNGLIRVM